MSFFCLYRYNIGAIVPKDITGVKRYTGMTISEVLPIEVGFKPVIIQKILTFVTCHFLLNRIVFSIPT